ncbi:MAG: aminotransferase class I/II-fold pyridoxal phosphate-dependent enzyme [Oscillospiraceae bacterium]|nr:aminotransferase class I/II-fold pyridoxal phosphate-dependent enzyme [Oscillospiraceae bacterium]
MDYEKLIGKKAAEIKPSGIRKYFDVAATMDDVISLGVGEPDFHTPWQIRREAIVALERGKTFYTANSGLMNLRKSISEYTEKHTGVSYDPASEIIVTVGGSEAIDLTIRAIIEQGDEVIIPEPSFVCYKPIVELTGGTPIIIETKAEDSFKLTVEELKAAITEKTKLLILPYPNNPTGAIMEREDLEKIAEVLRGTNIAVLTDEIYSELTYGKKHFSIISLEGMKERTIYVNGFSKAFAMTGWRLGYMCAPHEITMQALKIHQFGIMSSPTISQYAAIEALTNSENDVKHMVSEYDIRRRYLVNAFRELGLDCFTPEGAFYVFPSIKSTGLSSDEFCDKLLHSKRVAVIPGNAFGDCGEGYIRVSYAYSLRHLMEAVSRIREFLDELRSENA